MEGFEILVKFLLAFALGGVIGLEREINEKKIIDRYEKKKEIAILGVRSFALIAGLGTIFGLVVQSFPILASAIGLIFVAMVVAFYIIDTKVTGDIGITTELAMSYSFLIGFLLTVKEIPFQVIFAVTIILVLLLSRKEKIKSLVEEIKKNEINAFISFAILAFVILPFLPNQDFKIVDLNISSELFKNLNINPDKLNNFQLFNPFKLWLIVVLITGIEIVGYILEKSLGKKKGWILTSIAGGFVSSTATTISLAKQSLQTTNINILVSSALFANAVSFIPAVLLILSLNGYLFRESIFIFSSLILITFAIATYFLFKGQKKEQLEDGHQIKERQIFNLISALKFVGLFLVINILSKVALDTFGISGFLITAALGALPGIDAVIINISQLAGNQIDFELAVWALIVVNMVNLLAKSIYSFSVGKREFAIKFLMSVILVIVVSIILKITR